MDGAETPSRNSDLLIFQRLIHIFLQLKHTYLGGEVWVMIHQPLMTSCCFETNGVVLPSQCGNNMLPCVAIVTWKSQVSDYVYRGAGMVMHG